MFAIKEYHMPNGKRIVKDGFATYAEAEGYAKANLDVMHYYEDADFPGVAADFMVNGQHYMIEPDNMQELIKQSGLVD